MIFFVLRQGLNTSLFFLFFIYLFFYFFAFLFRFLWFSICGLLGNFTFLFTRPSLLAWIKRPVCITTIPQNLMRLILQNRFLMCIYHLSLWSNFNFLLNSLRITFPTQLFVDLSFCTSLLHSLIMWLSVSYLSLHLLFCCVSLILLYFALAKQMTTQYRRVT